MELLFFQSRPHRFARVRRKVFVARSQLNIYYLLNGAYIFTNLLFISI